MSALQPYVDGNVVPASQLIQRDPITAIKPSDQTVNNSATLVNDSALFIPLAANATYQFTLRLKYNSGATPGFKTNFTVPAGATMDITIAAFVASVWGFFLSSNGSISVTGTGGDVALTMWGEVTTTGTAGNLQLQWAQNTANVSNTIVRASSSLIARQVA